jgi:2-methylcitrate dehydratase PrpD
VAAFLARTGTTGPAQVFEGRFGLFASHLQDPAARRDFTRIADGLGTRWDSRNSSFKPFPAAHVLHPYIDALWRLQRRHGFTASDVEQIDCPVASFIVPIVCEPTVEKLAPATDSHGRVSLQYTLAEALYCGELGRHSYRAGSLANPEILALARRVRYEVDPAFPGPGRFKGAVNPMTDTELGAKFDENASGFLSADGRAGLVEAIRQLERMPDASVIVELTIPESRVR